MTLSDFVAAERSLMLKIQIPHDCKLFVFYIEFLQNFLKIRLVRHRFCQAISVNLNNSVRSTRTSGISKGTITSLFDMVFPVFLPILHPISGGYHGNSQRTKKWFEKTFRSFSKQVNTSLQTCQYRFKQKTSETSQISEVLLITAH